MCIIPSPCSNFNCCSNPSSRWQRQRIKPLLFKSTILAYTSLMNQLWANMNTLQQHRSLWMDIQSKRALFLCQLSVAKYTQSYTIWGTYTLYVPKMVHNCGWPYMAFSVCFQTYVFHYLLYSGKFLREKTFANCSLLQLGSCRVVLVKRLHF